MVAHPANTDEYEVEADLVPLQVLKRRLEGDREQESGDDLCPCLHGTQLLQDVGPVAVGLLARRFVPAIAR